MVLEQKESDLKPGNAKAAKITVAMLLREFLALRVAPTSGPHAPLVGTWG